MNIWEREAQDIRNYLDRHGYASTQKGDHILVNDPVEVYNPKHHTEYKEIVIRDWPTAISFVEERS